MNKSAALWPIMESYGYNQQLRLQSSFHSDREKITLPEIILNESKDLRTKESTPLYVLIHLQQCVIVV